MINKNAAFALCALAAAAALLFVVAPHRQWPQHPLSSLSALTPAHPPLEPPTAGLNPAARQAAEATARWAASVDAQHRRLSEASDMAEVIALLRQPVDTEEDVDAAAEALRLLNVLVEPIDNANDMHKMGGITAVVALLQSPHPTLAGAASRVLATSASNNAQFQSDLLAHHPEAVPHLTTLLLLKQHPDTSSAALLALANILRASETARTAFANRGGGPALLQLVVPGGAGSEGVQRRAITLVTDLLSLEPQVVDKSSVAAAVVEALRHSGSSSEVRSSVLDLRERALVAVAALAADPPALSVLRDKGVLTVLGSVKRELRLAIEQVGGEHVVEVLELASAVARLVRGPHDEL